MLKEYQVKCPNCGEYSGVDFLGANTEVWCELCGTHDGFHCPQCDELYDLARTDEKFEIVEVSQ